MPAFLFRFFSPQFIKFCVVGGLGLLTDSTIFFIISMFVAKTDAIANYIWLAGYAVAVLQNYLINHHWTFKQQTADVKASGKGFFTFFIVSVTALVPRYIVYLIILHYIPMPEQMLAGIAGVVSITAERLYMNLANICGIAVATIVNFLGSKYIVFKAKP